MSSMSVREAPWISLPAVLKKIRASPPTALYKFLKLPAALTAAFLPTAPPAYAAFLRLLPKARPTRLTSCTATLSPTTAPAPAPAYPAASTTRFIAIGTVANTETRAEAVKAYLNAPPIPPAIAPPGPAGGKAIPSTRGIRL